MCIRDRNVIVRDIIGAQDVRILTGVGKVATLPNAVSVVFNDGTTEDKKVTWERELTAEDVSKIGTVEILGSIEGISGIQAKAIIVVSDNYEEKNVALREKGDYPKAFTSYSGPDSINNINDGVISKGNNPQNRWTNWGLSLIHIYRQWRELYPEDKLAEIKELVDVGHKSKTQFIWAIHPGFNMINWNDYDNELQTLLNKLEQLYEMCIRDRQSNT